MASPHDSTSSSANGDLPELRSTPAGIEAQAEAAELSRRIDPAVYAGFLRQFTVPYSVLRARASPRGKRFTLP
jgi:hypothetical protein